MGKSHIGWKSVGSKGMNVKLYIYILQYIQC